jgi:FMN-dependent NADH-azoreductase
MSTLFRLDSSIRGAASVSHEIADTLVAAWLDEHPDGTVTKRDLAETPVSPADWANAVSVGFGAELTDERKAAVALATAIADEMAAADTIVIGAPFYNFGVSSHLKAWIDLLITEPRFAPGSQPLAGKPVVLVITRGGGYGPGTPREGWDHATAYLRRIFGDVFGGELTLVETELTLAEVNPAMADLREKAAELKSQSHALADETGRALAKLAAA